MINIKEIILYKHIGTIIHGLLKDNTFIFSTNINNIYIIIRRGFSNQYLYDSTNNEIKVILTANNFRYDDFLIFEVITHTHRNYINFNINKQINYIIPIITEYIRECNLEQILA